MKRVPEITADGSSSFYWWIIKNLTTPNMALYKEAKHIFLRNALDEFEGKEKLAFWKWATAHQLERLSEFFFWKAKKIL